MSSATKRNDWIERTDLGRVRSQVTGVLVAQRLGYRIFVGSIGGGTGGPGGTGPQLSAYKGLAALGPQLCDCDLVLHWCNSKIEQLQHIHKPHVTLYMRKLYLMAALSLMFHFLESFRRSLLLEARFSAWNSPNTVWRPGSTRARWGS